MKCVLLAILAIAACSRRPATNVVPIAVVSWPAPIRPSCYLDDDPDVPEITMYNAATTASQYYTPLMETAKVVEYLRDVARVRKQERECLQKLITPP